MTILTKLLALAAAIALFGIGPALAEDDEAAAPPEEAPKSIPFERGPYEVRVERSHFVEMRDGVRLMTDLYFPEGYDGKLPVILERTPYDKALHRNSNPDDPITSRSIGYYFASQGYVVAVQDRRGKFESEGEYTLGYGDVNDAEDTLDWFLEQDWFNGRVGMIGCSIPGGNVVKAAMSQHETLKGLIPQSAAFGHGTAGGTMARGFIRGGVQNMTMPIWTHTSGSKVFFRPPARLDRDKYLEIVDFFDPAPRVSPTIVEMFDAEAGQFSKETMQKLLHLPAVEIDDVMGSPPSDWDDMVASGPMDPFWTNGDYLDDEDKVAGGALHINSWHDYGINETLLQFQHFQNNAVSEWARDNQYVIVGPLGHCALERLTSETVNGERELGDARFDAWGTYLKWWDYTLKEIDNGFANTPKIQYFLPGANEWRSSDTWPISGTEPTKLYLSSGGQANTRLGDGALNWSVPSQSGHDSYVYDPAAPVIVDYMKSVFSGAFDMAEVEMREDILVYSTTPLKEAVEMTGKIRAQIWLSADVPDTDLSVTILDVYPDGRVFPIQKGYLRLRYREGFDKEVMMEPGKVYAIDLDMLVGANLFNPGHRIRIEVTSSDFPGFARNLNTGGDNARDTEHQPATVRIHHGPGTPSHIELPLIPRKVMGQGETEKGLGTLLNHLYLSLDTATYQAIAESDFLRNEFAVSETRTTIRSDYPDGYTGVYFYGDETYFEFFDAANSAFPLGNFGIASGFEAEGQFETARKALDARGGGIVRPVDRQVDGAAIPWFTGLFGATESGYRGPSVWGMQYNDEFIQEWLGHSSELDGSILQRDFLHSYAMKLDQTELRDRALMKDVTFIEAVLDPQYLSKCIEQFVALGWTSEEEGICHLLEARNAKVLLCPVTEERGVGIYELGFSLHGNPEGPQTMQLGSSTLAFEDKTAEWRFSIPEAHEAPSGEQ